MRLRSNLYLLVAGTLLPLIIVAALLGQYLIERERAALIGVAMDRNRAFMTAVDTELRVHVTTLQALSALASLDRDDLNRFREDAVRALKTQPGWHNLILVSASGEQLVNARLPYGAALPPLTDVESFRRVLETRAPVVGDLSIGASTQRAGIGVRVPVERSGELVYVLTAVVAPDSFLKLIEAQELPRGWASGVVDAKGQSVARLPKLGPGGKPSPNLLAAIARSRQGWYRGVTLDGLDSYTTHHTSSFSNWSVAYAIPASYVNATAYRVASYLTGAALLGLAVALAFAYWMARRISVPMSRLAGYARALGRHEPSEAPRLPQIAEVQLVSQALVEANLAVRERELLLEREQSSLKASARAKDEFIAMLGHELRNPLSAVSNSTELLRRGGDHPGIAAKAREVIERQVRHMARLLDDLLDVSRVTRGKLTLKRETFDLAELTAKVVASWSALGARHAQITTTFEPVTIEADKTRVEQILTNLLDNAEKFSSAGAPIEVRVKRSGEEAVLEVKDEGEGIPPELLERLFDPFVQAPQGSDRARGGMGIGLALVKRLAELHGGTVVAFSEGRGKGACLSVRLPAAGTA